MIDRTNKEVCDRIIETIDPDELVERLEVGIEILVWNLESVIADRHDRFTDLFGEDILNEDVDELDGMSIIEEEVAW